MKWNWYSIELESYVMDVKFEVQKLLEEGVFWSTEVTMLDMDVILSRCMVQSVHSRTRLLSDVM